MMTNVNQTYCGEHFVLYTNNKSFCTSNTNIILYVKYMSVKLKKKKPNRKHRHSHLGFENSLVTKRLIITVWLSTGEQQGLIHS